MPSYNWDKHRGGTEDGTSSYVKFTVVGDHAEGELVNVGETDFGDATKTPVPVLHLKGTDGVIRLVTCSQVNLLRIVADLGPDIGDHVSIVFEGEDQTRRQPGKNAPKIFKVGVTPKAMQGTAPATVPATPAGDASEPF